MDRDRIRPVGDHGARSGETGEIFRGHIAELDALRGIAIIAVLMNHTWPAWSDHGWALFQLAWTAMDCFFVMSGFLITGILLDSRARPDYYRSFYTRRALRILPLYYLVIVGLTCLSYLRPDDGVLRDAWGSPAWFFVYLGSIPTAVTGNWPLWAGSGLIPLWSLQVEEQFYLFLPPLVRKLRVETLTVVLVCAAIASPILCVGLYVWMPGNTLIQYVLLPCRMTGFALGGLLAIRFRRGPWPISKLWLSVLTVAGLGITAVVGVAGGLIHTKPLIRTLGFPTASAASACLILWLIVFRGTRITACLRLRPVQHLGKISYGIYLLHWPVMIVLSAIGAAFGSKLMMPGFGRVVLVPAVTFAVASLSWKYFESPILELKDQLAPAVRPAPAFPSGLAVSGDG